MTSGSDRPDDDALRWDGDDELDALPKGWRAVGKGADRIPVGAPSDEGALEGTLHDAPDAHDETSSTFSNASLLGIGILAGVYLLYTIGWFVGAGRIAPVAPVLLGGDLPFRILTWLAIAAPFVWFVVTFVLTLRSRTWVRFAWLGAGALLLVPWPLVMPFASAGGGAL